MSDDLDRKAHQCFDFDPDPICERDRKDFEEWEHVPRPLRQWYRDRVERRIFEPFTKGS